MEAINVGYTAPKSAVYNRPVVVRMGREVVQKGAWQLGRVVHNLLNMSQKRRWHRFGSEPALIGIVVRLQQLL